MVRFASVRFTLLKSVLTRSMLDKFVPFRSMSVRFVLFRSVPVRFVFGFIRNPPWLFFIQIQFVGKTLGQLIRLVV